MLFETKVLVESNGGETRGNPKVHSLQAERVLLGSGNQSPTDSPALGVGCDEQRLEALSLKADEAVDPAAVSVDPRERLSGHRTQVGFRVGANERVNFFD